MPKPGLLVIDVSGSPYERGKQQGEQLRSLIKAQLSSWLDALSKAHHLDGSGNGSSSYIDAFLAETSHVPAIIKHTPDLFEEIKGIADGAQVPFNHVLAYNLLDEEWDFGKKWDKRNGAVGATATTGTSSSSSTPASVLLPPGCSVAGFQTTAATFLGQTMDIPAMHDGSQVVVRHHLPSDPSSDPSDQPPKQLICFTTAGMLVLMGCNSSGLAVVVNNLSMLPSSPSGLPVAFIVRGALSHTSLDAAENFIRSTPHATGQHYALASPEGLISLEASANGHVYPLPTGDPPKILHTNHPLHHQSQSLCPTFIDGPGLSIPRLSILESAYPTFQSEQNIMDALKTNIEAPISREKGNGVVGWMTFGSLVVKVDKKENKGIRVWVAPGPPHLVDYEEVGWGNEDG